MISKDVWILIRVKGGYSLPSRAADYLRLIYAKVIDPFYIPSGVFIIRAVTMAWKGKPSYRFVEKVSNLNEVILLKRILF
jgi:hypothetical protein